MDMNRSALNLQLMLMISNKCREQLSQKTIFFISKVRICFEHVGYSLKNISIHFHSVNVSNWYKIKIRTP